LPESAAKRNRVARVVDGFFERASRLYDKRLRSLIRRPWLVIGVVGILVALGGLTFMTVPTEFSPAADVGRVFITIEAPEGSSFDYMDRQARRMEQIIMTEMDQSDDIERVMVRVPAFGGDTRTGDVNTARAIVILKDWHERERAAREVTQKLLAEIR